MRRSLSYVLALAAITSWLPAARAQEAATALPDPQPSAAAPSEPPPAPAETAPQPLAAEPASAPLPAPPAPPEPDAAIPNEPTSNFEGDPWGDEPANIVAGPLSFRVLLQTRYEDTFAKPSQNPRLGYATAEDVLVNDGDGFSLQRFFFRMAAEPAPWLGFKAILDFAKLRGSDVSNVVKQAYATLRPIPKRLEFAAGVFKLPFSILELDPVARYELTDLGDADEFAKALGFAGRDVGAEIMLAPLDKPRWLRIMAGAFRAHAKDEEASPLGAMGARLESKPSKHLRLGVDIVGMPFSANYKRPFETSSKEALPIPPDPLYPNERRWTTGKAYSADVTYSQHRLMLRAEGMLGDRVDVDLRYGARSFWAVWGLAAYRVKAGPLQLMPAARAEWLDVDREHKNGGRLELTLGLSVLYKKSVRFVLDVTRTQVQKQTPVLEQPEPIPLYPYFDLSNTRVVVQLQVEI
jgi:hypothetical protein